MAAASSISPDSSQTTMEDKEDIVVSESPPSSMDESPDESVPKGCGVGLFGYKVSSSDLISQTDPKVILVLLLLWCQLIIIIIVVVVNVSTLLAFIVLFIYYSCNMSIHLLTSLILLSQLSSFKWKTDRER